MMDKLIDRISIVGLAVIITGMMVLFFYNLGGPSEQHPTAELTFPGIGIQQVTLDVCLQDTMFVYEGGRHHPIPEYLKPVVEHALSVYYDEQAGINRAADPGIIDKPL